MLPWSRFWDENYFSTLWPHIGMLLRNNFVRGGISGLGLVNLCAGFIDLSVAFGARDRLERDPEPTAHATDDAGRSR